MAAGTIGRDVAKELDLAKIKMAVMRIPALALGSDDQWAMFVAPGNIKVLEVGVAVDDAITGADTNYYTLGFINAGADGNGTDVIGEKAYTSGVDLADFVYDPFTVTPANARLDKDDTIIFDKTEGGTGLGSPDLCAYVKFEVLAVG